MKENLEIENKKKIYKEVYVDHSATTPVKDEVLKAMIPYYSENFGNPSSIYKKGQLARRKIESSRKIISQTLNCNENEIYFTSSGTESNNWAIRGVLNENKKEIPHIICSKIEHHSVLKTFQELEKNGYEVSFLDVDEFGIVNTKELEKLIKKNTVLISIMYANNEIGTIMPIKELAGVAKKYGILFHCDCVQAYPFIKIDLKDLGIDLATFSAHKIYGPKGIGALYIKNGTKISNLLFGGAQEKNRRPSTENVANIVGFATAASLLNENQLKNNKLLNMRDKLIEKIIKNISNVRLNGHRTKRLPNNVNISFNFIEGESLLLMLDEYGISASSGSACTSGSLDPSHVLLAMNIPHEVAHGSLRITFGLSNTEDDVEYIFNCIKKTVKKLREWSPLTKINNQ